MKASFAFFAAVAAAIPTQQGASLGKSLDARGVSVPLPDVNGAVTCYTGDNSPGTSNIEVGANKFKSMTQDCAPTSSGGEARMVAGGKYQFLIVL